MLVYTKVLTLLGLSGHIYGPIWVSPLYVDITLTVKQYVHTLQCVQHHHGYVDTWQCHVITYHVYNADFHRQSFKLVSNCRQIVEWDYYGTIRDAVFSVSGLAM